MKKKQNNRPVGVQQNRTPKKVRPKVRGNTFEAKDRKTGLTDLIGAIS